MISSNLKEYIYTKIVDNDKTKRIEERFKKYKNEYIKEIYDLEKSLAKGLEKSKDIHIYASINRCDASIRNTFNMADKHMLDIVAELEMDKSKKSKEFIEKAISDSINAIIKEVRVAIRAMNKHIKFIKKEVNKFAL